MPAVPLQCPTCAGLIQIDTGFAGQAVACPLCQSGMVVPPEEMLLEMLAAAGDMPALAPPEPPPGDVLTLGCPVCTGPFQVLTSMGGQQVACPHCGSPVTIPISEPPAGHHVPGGVEPAVPLPAGETETEPPPAANDLLPPGAAPPIPPFVPKKNSRSERSRDRWSAFAAAADLSPPSRPARPASDDFLPPGARNAPRETESDLPRINEFLPPTAAKAKREPISDLLPPNFGSAAKKPSPAAAAAPSINDLLPPTGALAKREAFSPQPGPQSGEVENLLPPGAASLDVLLPHGALDFRAPETSPGADRGAASAPATALDALLPPGAGEAAATIGEQVAIPAAPKRSPTRHLNVPANTIVVPTPEGGFVTIAETPKTVGEGEDVVEIRRLSSEEKAKRRFRKNLIFGGFCLAILIVVLVMMLW